MRNKKKRRSKRVQRLFLFLIIAVIIMTVALGVQIKKLQELNASPNKVSNFSGEQQNDAEKIDANAKIDILKYDSFIGKVYTQSQLENMINSDISDLYNNYDKPKEIEYECTSESASSSDIAENIVIKIYENDFNTVKSAEVIGQNELYYVVKVNYDYTNGSLAKRYSKNVIVFKNFYYDDEENVFNVDDVENVKTILDLDNYINDFSNGAKIDIQSFIQKNGQNYEYTLYYLSLNYGQSDKKDTVDLMKKVVSIDVATGKVVGTDKVAVRTGIEI